MKSFWNTLLACFLILCITGCKEKSSPSFEDNITTENQRIKEDILTALEKSVDKNELAGLSVRLIHQGEEKINFNTGMAHTDLQIPITDSTIFRIASISKSFTALALMQLQEQGKVNLDTDVSTYLGWELRNPGFPEQPITLSMLMSHQSSIRDGKGYSRFASNMLTQDLNIKELFQPSGAYFAKDMFAEHAPGTYFSYTNCTWGIIASVIEKVSGLTLEEYCSKNIFQPMEMDASFDPAHLSNLKNLAVLYRFENNEWVPQADDYQGEHPAPRTNSKYIPGSNGLLYGPQGSLRCSVNDLEKLARLFWNGGIYKGKQIITKSALELMSAKHWSYNGTNGDTWDGFFHSYGLGLHHITNTPEKDVIFPDRKMLGHPGIAYGLLSDLYFDTDTETAVIFVTNGSKKAYEYGKSTTFYQPEEDVFKLLYPLLQTNQPQ